MARIKTPMAGIKFLVGKYQNNNDKTTAYQKWYYRPVILSTLDTEDMAEHMMDHGCLYGSDVIKGVLEKFFECTYELLFQNRRVKLNGIGTLCMSVKSEGATSKEDLSTDMIKQCSVYLLPDASNHAQLTGKKLASRMSFSNIASSSFVDMNNAGEGEGDGGDGGDGGNTEP